MAVELLDKGLGQREAFEGVWLDRRDALHSVDPYLEGIATASPADVTHQIGPILDQKSEGACVGFTGAGFLNCMPVSFKPEKMMDNADGLRFYHRAQEKDEWPGTNYSGTSARGLAKVFVEEDWIDGRYLWADSIAKINAWLREFGPVMFGCRWPRGMYDTDPRGFKWPNGEIVGGHEFLIFGVSRWDTWKCQNSWGEDEGIDGCFYLTPETQRRLMALGNWSALTVEQLTKRERRERRGTGSGGRNAGFRSIIDYLRR